MKTLSRKSSITFQINETESFAATGGIHGRNSGARRPENREPQGGCRERTGTAGVAAARQKQYGRPRKPCSRNRTGKSRYKGDRQPKIRCRNRRKTVDSRKPGGGIEQAETAAKRLTGNRHKAADHRKPDGQSRRKTIDSRNRSAETIDNRKSGRRELPETAAARLLRRISRDGPRQRIPLPT